MIAARTEREKICEGDETMRAALLVALDAGNRAEE